MILPLFFEESDFNPGSSVRFILNETISSCPSSSEDVTGLVCHHLTPDILDEQKKEFERQFPNIKGSLTAVFMGGRQPGPDYDRAAKILARTADNEGGTTFFVCPSRRTRKGYKTLSKMLKRYSGIRTGVSALLLGPDTSCVNKVTGTSFRKASKGFNPYIGLMAKADHIVVIGHSHSIFSEALYSGKTVHVLKGQNAGTLIKNRHPEHIAFIENLGPEDGFATKDVSRLNITSDVAQTLADEFKKMQQERRTAVINENTVTALNHTSRHYVPDEAVSP